MVLDVLKLSMHAQQRMRAAVFVNAVAVREACSLKNGLILSPECRQKLCTANYLFHSALNCDLV